MCVFLAAIYDVVEEKADSEPDFQYIPEKSPQDPTQLDQHALRDSMVVLKDGLGSGAILAQFDVRRHISSLILLFPLLHITSCHMIYSSIILSLYKLTTLCGANAGNSLLLLLLFSLSS